VRVETPWGGVLLRSSQCPPERGRAGYRPPMPLERDILELWDKLGLCNGDLSPGNLIAFLKQARRLVER